MVVLDKRLQRILYPLFASCMYEDFEDAFSAAQLAVCSFIAIAKEPLYDAEAYARRVMMRELTMTAIRRRRLTPVFSVTADIDEWGSVPINHPAVDREIDVQILIGALPEKYRSVIRLYYFEGYQLKQIADILEVTVGCIRKRHQRALLLLRRMIRPD